MKHTKAAAAKTLLLSLNRYFGAQKSLKALILLVF